MAGLTPAEDSTLQRAASELEASLVRAGLPVRCGIFADLPDLIRWPEGQTFSPLVLEGHRQSALVAILTDGHGIAIANDSARDHGVLVNLLRCLAEWPRLSVVDFGYGRHGAGKLASATWYTLSGPRRHCRTFWTQRNKNRQAAHQGMRV